MDLKWNSISRCQHLAGQKWPWHRQHIKAILHSQARQMWGVGGRTEGQSFGGCCFFLGHCLILLVPAEPISLWEPEITTCQIGAAHGLPSRSTCVKWKEWRSLPTRTLFWRATSASLFWWLWKCCELMPTRMQGTWDTHHTRENRVFLSSVTAGSWLTTQTCNVSTNATNDLGTCVFFFKIVF